MAEKNIEFELLTGKTTREEEEARKAAEEARKAKKAAKEAKEATRKASRVKSMVLQSMSQVAPWEYRNDTDVYRANEMKKKATSSKDSSQGTVSPNQDTVVPSKELASKLESAGVLKAEPQVKDKHVPTFVGTPATSTVKASRPKRGKHKAQKLDVLEDDVPREAAEQSVPKQQPLGLMRANLIKSFVSALKKYNAFATSDTFERVADSVERIAEFCHLEQENPPVDVAESVINASVAQAPELADDIHSFLDPIASSLQDINQNTSEATQARMDTVEPNTQASATHESSPSVSKKGASAVPEVRSVPHISMAVEDHMQNPLPISIEPVPSEDDLVTFEQPEQVVSGNQPEQVVSGNQPEPASTAKPDATTSAFSALLAGKQADNTKAVVSGVDAGFSTADLLAMIDLIQNIEDYIKFADIVQQIDEWTPDMGIRLAELMLSAEVRIWKNSGYHPPLIRLLSEAKERKNDKTEFEEPYTNMAIIYERSIIDWCREHGMDLHSHFMEARHEAFTVYNVFIMDKIAERADKIA